MNIRGKHWFPRALTTTDLSHKSSEFSSSQQDALHAVILCCSTLSLIGCLYIVRHHYVSARQHSGVSMVQKMVVVLSIFDVGLSFPRIFGNPMTADKVSMSCNVQAFVLHLFGLMSIVWNAAIAHCFYRKIVYRDSEVRLKSRFKLYVLLAIVPSVSCSVALYATRLFGDATFYCWVSSRSRQFWSFYLFVIGAILYVSVILLITHNHIARDFRNANLDAQESWAVVTSKLRIYNAAFVVLWTPSTVFRLLDSELGSARFVVAILMHATVCTQGFATAVIYGGLLTKLYRIVSCKPSVVHVHKFASSSAFLGGNTSAAYSLVKHYHQPANIFVSTFNMGEARLTPGQLDKWIPLGHDIYVIGLQECLHLENTRSLLRQHLEGRRPRPAARGTARKTSKFRQFNREIGSKNTSLGYHGHIAITVFIKSSDVDSGAFYMPPVVQQEVNGKSKVRRRNRDSQDILQELHLNLEDVGFEFPHVHHHSFVLGDLNYRLRQRDANAATILELVSKVRQCEAAKPAPTKRNRSLRRGLLGKRWSPMDSRGLNSSFGLGGSQGDSCDMSNNELDVSMLGHSIKSTSSVFASSNGSVNSVQYSAGCEFIDEDQFVWDDVLAHDELLTGMRNEQIFYGFCEAKIAFPPTFRRVRGAALNFDARNWSMGELTQCYTTSVEGHGVRIPSYTDRILFFSQPDMRHRLRCAVYASCEEVDCSDHKPVLAVFQALVNRDFLPIETELSTKKLQRMQDVTGVLKCQLRLDLSKISWRPDGEIAFASTSFSNSLSLDRRVSNYDRPGHQVMVTIVFPLPSEDDFSAQRKLLELANSMSGGVYLENTDRLLCKTTVAHVKWVDFVRDGVTHTTFARPTGNMHVAIKVHAGTQCFGQGVICIPQATKDASVDSVDRNNQMKHFVVELAHGGRHTGTMSGSIGLQLLQRASDA